METEPSASAAMRLRGMEEIQGGENSASEVMEAEWWKDPISEEEERS